MIAIGNGESCPFCKGKDKFISSKDNDIFKHMIDEHKIEIEESLFGGKDIGI